MRGSRSAQRRSEGTGTQTATVPGLSADENEQPRATLRLHLSRRHRVRWTSDTRDNEHEGKKSSKSCCIYHKKRSWDESSTESESDGSDGGGDDNGGESDGSSSSGGPGRPAPPPQSTNGAIETLEASDEICSETNKGVPCKLVGKDNKKNDGVL